MLNSRQEILVVEQLSFSDAGKFLVLFKMFTKFAKLRAFTSAASPQKSTNWLVMVGIPSVLVAGSVYYYSSSPPKPVAALDPKEWKDFKLKEVRFN
jgi:hypothetical protein